MEKYDVRYLIKLSTIDTSTFCKDSRCIIAVHIKSYINIYLYDVESVCGLRFLPNSSFHTVILY